MKKVLVLLSFWVSISQAQLNLRWGSFITIEHPAVAEEYQIDVEFGESLAAKDNELVIGAVDFIEDGIEGGVIFYLKSVSGGEIKPLQWVEGNSRYSQANAPGATPEFNDDFGESIAIADMGGGSSKVIVGVPLEDIGSITNAGMIHEMNFDPLGLTGVMNFHQDTDGIAGSSEFTDFFGQAVSLGDFNGDGNIDVAIGVPGEKVDSAEGAGAVNVIMAGADGLLTTTNNQFWSQNTTGIGGTAEESDGFGRVLTTGDFNGDGKSDLAIGVPSESIGSVTFAGSVNVLYGSSGGLSSANDQVWHQDSDGIIGTSESIDSFGSSLASGDFNGDGYDDLAIGVPDEDVSNNSVEKAGAVNVLYGSAAGLSASGNQFISQAESGFSGSAESFDKFGFSLAVGQFNSDSYDDLVIGIPYEDIGEINNAGAVVIVHGSATGLQFNDELYLDESNFNSPIDQYEDRKFGWSLATGDLDNDNKDDLIISTNPRDDDPSNPESVLVAYQHDHDLIFENGVE